MKSNPSAARWMRKQNWRFAAYLFLLPPWLAGGQPSLSVGNTPGFPGATISVPVRVARATNIVGAQFDVAFNASKLTSGAPTLTPAHGSHIIRSREIAPGVRRTVVYSMNNTLLRTNGFTARIPFQLSADERVGSGPLAPQNVMLARRDRTNIAPVALNSGAIFVRSVNPLPDGAVQLFLPSEADERYVIQATTNFLSWQTLTNLTAFGNFMDLVDADGANHPYRFYRSVRAAAAGEFGAVTLDTDGTVHFQLSALAGRTYILQASTNLINWSNIRTNTTEGNAIDFSFPVEVGIPYWFFRVQSR